MTRLEMLENQQKLCRTISVYPQMQTVDRLAVAMSISVPAVRGMILKMTSRCLISEDEVNGKVCFFFPDDRDKKKTLDYIQERIDLMRKADK